MPFKPTGQFLETKLISQKCLIHGFTLCYKIFDSYLGLQNNNQGEHREMFWFIVYSKRLLRWPKLLGSTQGDLRPLTCSMGPRLDLSHILWMLKRHENLTEWLSHKRAFLSLYLWSPLRVSVPGVSCTGSRFSFLPHSMAHSLTASFWRSLMLSTNFDTIDNILMCVFHSFFAYVLFLT